MTKANCFFVYLKHSWAHTSLHCSLCCPSPWNKLAMSRARFWELSPFEYFALIFYLVRGLWVCELFKLFIGLDWKVEAPNWQALKKATGFCQITAKEFLSCVLNGIPLIELENKNPSLSPFQLELWVSLHIKCQFCFQKMSCTMKNKEINDFFRRFKGPTLCYKSSSALWANLIRPIFFLFTIFSDLQWSGRSYLIVDGPGIFFMGPWSDEMVSVSPLHVCSCHQDCLTNGSQLVLQPSYCFYNASQWHHRMSDSCDGDGAGVLWEVAVLVFLLLYSSAN